MLNLRNQLAAHELHIANYYFNKKAYIAAVNRASYIINKFDQTESIPNVLDLMVKSYQALGMHKLANDPLSMLNKNFPNYYNDKKGKKKS